MIMKLNGMFASNLALIMRLLIIMIIYSLLRIGFYGFNYMLFPQITFSELMVMLKGGLIFDLAAVLYLNMLFILMQAIPNPLQNNTAYKKVGKWVFVGINALGIALNLVDFVYYPFTLKRTTGTVFSQFANEENIFKLIFDFLIDYWYILLLFIFLIWVLVKSYSWITVKSSKMTWKYYLVQFICLLVSATLFVGGVRGGWAHSTRPITLSNAGDYVNSPEEMNIVLNTPFSIIKTLKAISLKEERFFTDAELKSIYPVIHTPKDSGEFKKLNVVFLILESFGKEHVGFFNKDLDHGNYKGYTPFLDSLISKSLTFNRSFANGRKSIDALPSIITGIPSIGEPFVLSIYSGNKTTSLAKILADQGYETAFFHGAPNGSMGFSAYLKLAGVTHYYGKNEYNNDRDFDGIWGIWDEPFMQYMADELDELKEPFFSSFFSLSSHHPFKIPEKYKGKFPKGTLPLHEPLGYSDYALKRFFDKASKSKWFKNTLFVICADHASMTKFPEYNTMANSFAIPIILYHPGGDLRGVSDRLVQQIDIMPTVLSYLNYQKPYFSFGTNALDSTQDNFLVNNIGSGYNFYMNDYFMNYDNDDVKSLYNLKKDPLLNNNLLGAQRSVQDSMVKSLRAFIQQYNNRMIHNKLIVD